MLQNIRGNIVWRAPAAFFFLTLRSIVCSPHLVSQAPEVSSVRADKTLMQDPFPPPPDGGVCSAQTNCVPSFMYVLAFRPLSVCCAPLMMLGGFGGVGGKGRWAFKRAPNDRWGGTDVRIQNKDRCKKNEWRNLGSFVQVPNVRTTVLF